MKGKRKEGTEHLILEVCAESATPRDVEQGIWNEGYENSNNNANTTTKNGQTPASAPKDGVGIAQPVGSSPRPSHAGPNPQPEITLNDGDKPVKNTNDDDEDDDSSDGDEPSIYKIFTPQSYERLLVQEAEQKKHLAEQKNNMQEGRLVDGKLMFGDTEEEEGEHLDKDPWLQNGMNLNEDEYGSIPPELCNRPIEEIDKFLKEQTFVVISKRFKKKLITRFSATKAFFILPPWNPIRKTAVLISTNQIFDYFIIFTILVNCILYIPPQDENKYWLDTAEYVFLAIYTVESLVKMAARGFFIHKYTYLRDPWNWLDFLVIVVAYLTIVLESVMGSSNAIGSVNILRTFRVFRALKTVSIIPGLKTIIGALLKSMRMLAEVIILTLFCMMVFALFALQVYAGALRQKCIKDIAEDVVVTPQFYSEYIKNDSNWYERDGDLIICGNATGAGKCPLNYTCLPNIGDNPNFGYTNYDNFGWAMLNAFQLITLDFWEDNYNKVIRANGPWNVIFFIVVVFFGSFYLINLMLAVVSMSYEEEAVVAGKERDREMKSNKKKKEKEKKDAQAKQKKDQKDKNAKTNKKNADKSQTDTNHLQVMSAINGSTASSTSLKSVGNGAIKHNPVQASPEVTAGLAKKSVDKAKSVDSKGGKATNNKKPEITVDNNARSKHEGKLGIANLGPSTATTPTTTKKEEEDSDGYVNPLATMSSEDTISLDSNDGDPPKIHVKDDDEDDLVDRNCACCGRCCQCYIPWLKFQNMLYRIVSDLIFELFITLCIVLNVITMALDQHGKSQEYYDALAYANYVFTGIFTFECILKLFALSIHYFKSAWNVFDFIIVVVSFVDIAVTDVDGLKILQVFRLLRLLRIFRLAQTWSTMRMLLSIIMSTLGALGNLTLVLAMVIYIFAVIGVQLFSKTYTEEAFYPDPIPRWNFSNFYYSLMLIFRVMCGEWIEPLWDCMRPNGEICMAVFLPTLILGNFMVLNLFLALLINSFPGAEANANKDKDKDDSKVKQGWKKIKGLFKGKKGAIGPEGEKKTSMADLVLELQRQQGKGGIEVTAADQKEQSSPNGTATKPATVTSIDETFKTERSKFAEFAKAASKDSKEDEDAITKADDSDDERKEEEERMKSVQKRRNSRLPPDNPEDDDSEPKVVPGDIQDCWPAICYKKGPFKCCMDIERFKWGVVWVKFRKNMHKVTEHKIFEGIILFLIFASSISLCFEDIYLYRNPTLKDVLRYLNYVFVALFTIEMLMKWVAQGFKKYFTSFWTILDFCIVIISLVSVGVESSTSGNIDSLRALRTLRALRPLRAISRWQGMRIVVNALVYAIPSIANVFLVCIVFWLLFSIAGVQLLKGTFYKCVDENWEKLPYDVIQNRSHCEANAHLGYRWENSQINFDNILNGYLALFQVATFEGWMEIIEDATDSTDIDEQPKEFANYHMHWFFIAFIIIGSFLMLNLFIGVIIDNFNMLKKKYEGGYLDMFLTSSQKNYYNTMKKLGNKKPQKTIKRPKNKIQGFFFDVAMSNKFELAIVILIFLNMIAMAVEHYNQSKAYTDALDIMNIIFTTIFALEAFVKVIGMRWHYFRRAWNVFDFIIVILSVLGVVLDDLLSQVFITPTLLRVVRVFRIGRVLRLIKVAKGIRKLLFALVISMPALFNIGMLLFLITFIYAIFGMNLFGNVRLGGFLDDVTNFQTFVGSMVALFRLTTAAGWNDVLYPLMISEPDCDPNFFTMPDGERIETEGGDCGDNNIAPMFMCTFIMFTYLIIINTYIAVILENFNQAHEQEEVGITEDDFEMFYVVWERYDPHATQFIKYEQLSDFVGDLEQPLGIPKPNEIALVAFDLPIYDGDRLHCLDILISLVKHVLGGVEETEEFKELKLQMEEKYRETFPTRVQQVVRTTTMQRKKQDVAAKTLQRCWRKHRVQKNIRKITEMAMEAKHARERSSFSVSTPGTASPRDGPSTSKQGPPLPSMPERPPSASSTRSFRSIKSANATKKRSGGGMGNSLTVPSAKQISLPSDGKA